MTHSTHRYHGVVPQGELKALEGMMMYCRRGGDVRYPARQELSRLMIMSLQQYKTEACLESPPLEAPRLLPKPSPAYVCVMTLISYLWLGKRLRHFWFGITWLCTCKRSTSKANTRARSEQHAGRKIHALGHELSHHGVEQRDSSDAAPGRAVCCPAGPSNV